MLKPAFLLDVTFTARGDENDAVPVHAVNKRHAVSTTTFCLCFLCVGGGGVAPSSAPTSFSAGLIFFLVGLVALLRPRALRDNNHVSPLATAAPRVR